MSVRKLIADIIYPEYASSLSTALYHSEKHLTERLEEQQRREEVERQNVKLDNEIQNLHLKNLILIKELDDKEKTSFELHCEKDYKEVSKYAYKDKRYYISYINKRYTRHAYSVYPNEMIQPDKFLVIKEREKLGMLPLDVKQRAEVVGRHVDLQLIWTDDKDTTQKVDFYHSPVESIVSKRVDCESHSFLVSSLDPENFGVAFGMCGTIGHAWNVFYYNKELWCLETNSTTNWSNSGNTKVFKYKDQSLYKIHAIFTKNKTYEVDNSVVFGFIDR